MKKIITLGLILMLFGAMVSAQNAASLFDPASGNTGNREVTDLVCPEGSLYSQLPDGINAWIGLNGYVFYDNLLTAPGAPVKTVTFWMLKDISDPVNLDIIFRQDGGGIPGAVIASYNVSLTGVGTGEIWNTNWEAFEYTYELPSAITLAAGDWVGIQANPNSYGHHYWLTSSDGDMASYLLPEGVYVFDLAFCLGGATNIPVAPWALAIGIALIAVTVIIRFRRF